MFRFKTNVNANTNFHLQVGNTGCCGDSATGCKYFVEYEADGTTITGIDFKDASGNVINHVFATPFAEDDPTLINKNITAALEEYGAVTDGKPIDIYVFKETLTADDYITIEIHANFEITNLVRASDATNAFEAFCTPVGATRYEVLLDEGADMDFVLDDEVLQDPQAVANLDATTAADTGLVAQAVHDALAALYGDDFKRVKVTYNASTLQYKVQFWLRDSQQPTIAVEGGDIEAIPACETMPDFE